MSQTLRSSLIHLAHEHPEHRKTLLPLLQEKKAVARTEYHTDIRLLATIANTTEFKVNSNSIDFDGLITWHYGFITHGTLLFTVSVSKDKTRILKFTTSHKFDAMNYMWESIVQDSLKTLLAGVTP